MKVTHPVKSGGLPLVREAHTLMKHRHTPHKRVQPTQQLPRVVRQVNRSLANTESPLNFNPKLTGELETYLATAPLIPRYLDASKRKTVKKAQAVLSELDANLTRVATINFEVAKILQSLVRLEILVKRALLEVGRLSERVTRPAAAAVVSLVSPQLSDLTSEWTGVKDLCTIVHGRLSDSKDSLKLQMRLDEAARWAEKIAP